MGPLNTHPNLHAFVQSVMREVCGRDESVSSIDDQHFTVHRCKGTSLFPLPVVKEPWSLKRCRPLTRNPLCATASTIAAHPQFDTTSRRLVQEADHSLIGDLVSERNDLVSGASDHFSDQWFCAPS